MAKARSTKRTAAHPARVQRRAARHAPRRPRAIVSRQISLDTIILTTPTGLVEHVLTDLVATILARLDRLEGKQ